ncbi:hypothetical protein Q3V94_00500 [Caloramator sp. CAR-1]|uniref:hypothetical protein n=1 Tax=Caloramator sp. CAR-1 TaxID=3062777 RepID=UPI0026E1288F|nr:hypothetical protein [Caloramator sp. CAR-1]MDO6353563.1 hypothetical protein [Caloramator sp. CAR-1]
MSNDEMAKALTTIYFVNAGFLKDINLLDADEEAILNICKTYSEVYNKFLKATSKLSKTSKPKIGTVNKPEGW